MSGFSEEVAIAVTHPLWPAKDATYRSWSADIVFYLFVVVIVNGTVSAIFGMVFGKARRIQPL